jgi:hypothetical protein
VQSDPNTSAPSVPSATVFISIGLSPHVAPGDLTVIRLALDHAARRTSADGRAVRFLHGMYLPAHLSLLCAFAAESIEAVLEAARLTELPFTPVDTDVASRLAGHPAD